MSPRSFRLAVTAIALLICTATCVASEFQRGSYVGSAGGDTLTLKFDDKGKFFVMDKDGNQLIEGTYKVTKDEIEFKDEKGPLADVNAKAGKYKWKMEDKKLSLTKVEDESARRSKGLTSVTWKMEK